MKPGDAIETQIWEVGPTFATKEFEYWQGKQVRESV